MTLEQGKFGYIANRRSKLEQNMSGDRRVYVGIMKLRESTRERESVYDSCVCSNETLGNMRAYVYRVCRKNTCNEQTSI